MSTKERFVATEMFISIEKLLGSNTETHQAFNKFSVDHDKDGKYGIICTVSLLENGEPNQCDGVWNPQHHIDGEYLVVSGTEDYDGGALVTVWIDKSGKVAKYTFEGKARYEDSEEKVKDFVLYSIMSDLDNKEDEEEFKQLFKDVMV